MKIDGKFDFLENIVNAQMNIYTPFFISTYPRASQAEQAAAREEIGVRPTCQVLPGKPRYALNEANPAPGPL